MFCPSHARAAASTRAARDDFSVAPRADARAIDKKTVVNANVFLVAAFEQRYSATLSNSMLRR